jgi:hypothetical protein
VGVGAVVTLALATTSSRGGARSTTSHDPIRAAVVAPGAAAPGVAAPGVPLIRPIDNAERARLLDRIHHARELRTNQAVGASSPATSATSNSGPAPAELKVYDFSGGPLDVGEAVPPVRRGPVATKADLRFAIQSVRPLLHECYVAASDRLARKDGTISIIVRLTSEPEVATLVDSARLEGDTHLLADGALTECMRETLMSIELPAMAAGGKIEVHYPFTISG